MEVRIRRWWSAKIPEILCRLISWPAARRQSASSGMWQNLFRTGFDRALQVPYQRWDL